MKQSELLQYFIYHNVENNGMTTFGTFTARKGLNTLLLNVENAFQTKNTVFEFYQRTFYTSYTFTHAQTYPYLQ